MTIRGAIEEATSRVGPLREIAPKHWGYHIWSQEERAWVPATRTDPYRQARHKRAGTIAALAADSLVCNGHGHDKELSWQIIQHAYSSENTGTVSGRVAWILERLQGRPASK